MGSVGRKAARSEASLNVTAGRASDAGPKDANDDHMGFVVPADASALALKGVACTIADGVSAAEAGGAAAELCARGFLEDYLATPDSWTVETAAQTVLTALNRWLYSQGRDFDDPQRGFICTLSALVLKSRTAHLFHIGDSRIYRAREGTLEQLTEDHKLQINRNTSYLSRAMGLDLKVEIDHQRRAVEPGDVFLMSTDGLHGFVSNEAMLEACASEDLSAAANLLVQAALANGGDDNASCQLVRVISLPGANQTDVHTALASLPFPPHLERGQMLDGYRVLERIHESPRSQLYTVVEVETGDTLVLKTPSVNYEDDEGYIERFVMEPWIGSRVDSEHVLASVAPRQRQTFLYHLQEYVEGQTLEAWMAANPERDVGESVRIIEQIGKGLLALHRREIVHRDLKPDNIMVDFDGQVKIIDLGACYVAGVQELAYGLERMTALGTATYGAPELLRGEQATPIADLYSLGVISYELLTGKLPYGDTVQHSRTHQSYQRLDYAPAYQHNPLVPLWMNGALRRAVRIDPALRYGELTEFLHDLTHPNAAFTNERALPLMQRNPLVFWRTLCLVLALSQLFTLLYLTRDEPKGPNSSVTRGSLEAAEARP